MECIGELTREDLRERYGVESEFARVKEVAKIMGVSSATIYTQIRKGDFALPVRRVGDMPLVRVDHLLAWLNEPGEAGRVVVRLDSPALLPQADAMSPPPVDRMQAAIEKASAAVEKAKTRRSVAPRAPGG